MLQTAQRPLLADNHLLNLHDLLNQLTVRLAWTLVAAGSLGIWFTFIQRDFVAVWFWSSVGLVGIGLCVQEVVRWKLAVARHMLVWGLALGFLIVLQLTDLPWLPFLGIPLIFISTMLVPVSGEIVGLLILLIVYQRAPDATVIPFLGFSVFLIFTLVLVRLMISTFYAALHWAWNSQERATHLLQDVRVHQGELKQALGSFETANSILRRMEKELIAARQQAERARQMKEQFAANISHELRTPLNLILGFSEMLYLSPDLYGDVTWTPLLRKDLYQIYRNSQHLLTMIDDILSLSRFEMTEFALHKEIATVEDMLKSTSEIARGLFRQSSVDLVVDVEIGLPQVEIDSTRIRQVLLNLLNNALRFTETGTVTLAARREEDEIVIYVRDTGPGIPEDKLTMIFEEFYQVDLSLNRRHSGAGLGLAISKLFVDAHDGHIWAESEEGVGTTVFFTLPIPDHHIPLSRLTQGKIIEPLWPTEQASIVIIDPDPTVANLVSRYIENYSVIHVESTDMLPDVVSRYQPCAIVHNWAPWQSDQDDAIGGSIPIIQCALPSQAWMIQDLDVTACLTKPITGQQLLKEIDRIGQVQDILIVDDDRGFIQLVTRIIEASDRGYHLRHAYTGEEGIQTLQEKCPDLLLLDLVMPETDGFYLLSQIRQEDRFAQIPVILLTATTYAEDSVRQRGYPISIKTADGFRSIETLRYLKALLEVIQPSPI